LIEMSLNHIPCSLMHFPLFICWNGMYLIFIWLFVGIELVPSWPYGFLHMGDASSILWYSMLLLLEVLFYCLFKAIVDRKIVFLEKQIAKDDEKLYSLYS
jgi:hypothetical protein